MCDIIWIGGQTKMPITKHCVRLHCRRRRRLHTHTHTHINKTKRNETKLFQQDANWSWNKSRNASQKSKLGITCVVRVVEWKWGGWRGAEVGSKKAAVCIVFVWRFGARKTPLVSGVDGPKAKTLQVNFIHVPYVGANCTRNKPNATPLVFMHVIFAFREFSRLSLRSHNAKADLLCNKRNCRWNWIFFYCILCSYTYI